MVSRRSRFQDPPRVFDVLGGFRCASVLRAALRREGRTSEQAIPPARRKTMTNEIRIYVADLAAYNAGHLHGVWIDATQDVEDIQAQIDAMLKSSPVADAEEYAIHDYEGFDGYNLGEYEG